MFKKHFQNTAKGAKGRTASQFILKKASLYLNVLEIRLDEQIDKRLVRTLYDLFISILVFRHSKLGLLLSDLGAYLCGPGHAAAGTKRIRNLPRCKKWTHKLMGAYLFERADRRVQQLHQSNRRPLLLWDDSRIDKPESWFTEGLCSVWSSKAKRLTKVKRGFYRPPRHQSLPSHCSR